MVTCFSSSTPAAALLSKGRGWQLRPVFRGGLALACLLFMAALPALAAPRLETSLDPNTISLGDTATLSMTVFDCSPRSQPTVPSIPGLQFGAGGRSEYMNWVNGQRSSQVVFTLELHPTREGEFTIPSLTVNTDAGRLSSGAVKLRVVKGNAPANNGVPEAAFVRIVPSTTNVCLGQVFQVDVECYFQDNVSSHQMPQFNSDGFIIGAMPNPPDQSNRRVGGAIYHLYNFRVAVTPTRTGSLPLGPVTWGVEILSGQQSIFGTWIVTGRRPSTVTSDTPEINALPIPTNDAPPSFAGAIGQFALAQYEAGPLSVGVGDPVTLKIRIAGSGSFDTVVLPADEQGWREFKTYPPTSKLDTTDRLQIRGSKYFEQVISPLNAEIKEIPPFAFSYFDPSAGAFRTLTHPAISLSVHPTAATPQPTVIASAGAGPDAQQQNQEIVHIKPEAGTVRALAPPLVRQSLFLTLQALPPLAWVCAALWRRRKDKLAGNPRLRRRLEVARLVRQGLAGLPSLAAANDADNFYSTVLRLAREQLGERLDLPAPAITEAVLDQAAGLDPAGRELLRELFHACNQYRYTPEHTSQELASLIPKVKTALAGLQKMRDNGADAGKKTLQGAGVLMLLLMGAAAARAETISDAFARANKLYEEGKYSQAASVYDGIIQGGSVSPPIYFNAGNAWFKAGQTGRAIYDYRRAEEFAPRDPDIRANLGIARAQAGNTASALPGGRWTRWIGRATLNEWACAASAGLALFFIVLTVRQISPVFARSSGGLAFVLAVVSIWLLACLGLSIDQRLLDKSSIVIVPEAVVRRGPLEVSQSAFTAHDGAELLVLRREGDWLEVTDAARHIGWLQQKDVALMP